MRFLIRHPFNGEAELSSVDYFLDEYDGKGWEVVTSPPTGYDVPDIKAAKAARKDAAKPKETATTTTALPKDK